VFDSSRHREILNWTGGVIGVALIGMLGFALYALIYVRVPAENKEALTLLIGILSANVGLVVGFYFGSSSTAKKQTETIDTLAKTAQTAGVALSAPTDAIVIPPGESATATATEGGTVIEKDHS
jgi:hypothetical protein